MMEGSGILKFSWNGGWFRHPYFTLVACIAITDDVSVF